MRKKYKHIKDRENQLVLWKNFFIDSYKEVFVPEDTSNLLIEKHSVDISGYTFLRDMCYKVRNKERASFYSSENTQTDFFTNRLIFISSILNSLNINYNVLPFNSFENKVSLKGKNNLCNINVFIKSTKKSDKLIVYTAHHDIANVNSENCQDNSASVCNLLHLCFELQQMKVRNTNALIVFTDCEEMGGKGASFLSKQLKTIYKNYDVTGILSLELTSNGKIFWLEKSISNSKFFSSLSVFLKKNNIPIKQYGTPYNEAITLRWDKNDAICCGILPENDIKKLDDGGFARNWRLCHSMDDTFDRTARKKDMNEFVQLIKKLVNEL